MKRKTRRPPFSPGDYVPLSGPPDFWLVVESTKDPQAQTALAAALAAAEAEGSPDFPVFLVSMPREALSRLFAVVDVDKCIGVLPDGFSDLAAALDARGLAGVCMGRAFEERGRLGLRLNIDRVYADARQRGLDVVPARRRP